MSAALTCPHCVCVSLSLLFTHLSWITLSMHLFIYLLDLSCPPYPFTFLTLALSIDTLGLLPGHDPPTCLDLPNHLTPSRLHPPIISLHPPPPSSRFWIAPTPHLDIIPYYYSCFSYLPTVLPHLVSTFLLLPCSQLFLMCCLISCWDAFSYFIL